MTYPILPLGLKLLITDTLKTFVESNWKDVYHNLIDGAEQYEIIDYDIDCNTYTVYSSDNDRKVMYVPPDIAYGMWAKRVGSILSKIE